ENIWTAPYDGGMNGDGTLFYPWDSASVGGADPIPIESIRLKRIRDGREDYELLKLASAKSADDATAATQLAQAEFTTMDSSAVSNSSFDSTREQVMSLFGTVPSPPTGVVA